MTRDEIAVLLPLTPRTGMREAVLENCAEELGPEVALYWRESSALMDMGFIGWPGLEPDTPKPKWVARCRCGRCGNEWHSGWLKGGEGISAAQGEDGSVYPGFPEDDLLAAEIHEGDDFACPWCEENIRLLRKQTLKNGRTYRIMVGSIENAGPYTAVVAWMAERWLSPDGEGVVTLAPEAAAVIDGSGGLLFFSCRDSAWTPRKSTTDPFQRIYLSYDGAMNRKAGAWLWPDVPEQLGQTGEKTGIEDYFQCGGQWPVMYLRFWRGHRSVENLVKAGWLRPFEKSIDEEVLRTLQRGVGTSSRQSRLFAPSDLDILADWSAARPCDMLCMTKNEVRQGARWRWGTDMLSLWMGCVEQRIAFPGDASLLEDCRRRYGVGALQKWADMACEGRTPASLAEIDRYCLKQERKRGLPVAGALTMYLDYWEMLDEDAPTAEQIWPPDLRAAHDRAAASAKISGDKKYLLGFSRVLQTWDALEWSDGAICAVLPRSNGELVAEGKTLRHCVGGYGEQHVKGKLIVFIRHARRPERSWFTLNIDVTGKTWREVQLHGYGNEWAHGKRLHIPAEVRSFVDRWEAEVLTPAFRAVKAAEKAPKRREEAGAA